MEDLSEEVILQRRFVAQEALLTRSLKAYQKAGKTIKSSPAINDDCTSSYQTMLRELALYEHSMSRGRSVHNAALREIDGHISATRAVDDQLVVVRSEIEALRAQLEEEKHLRRQKEEYEALAHLINDHQSRDDTLKQLAQVNAELQALHEEKAATKAELERKSNEFGLFFHAATQLATSFQHSNNTNTTPSASTATSTATATTAAIAAPASSSPTHAASVGSIAPTSSFSVASAPVTLPSAAPASTSATQ